MFPPRVAFTHPRSAAIARALIVVSPIVIADVAFAAMGLDYEFSLANLAAAAIAGGFGFLLIRRAWHLHVGVPGVQGFSARCRSAGFLGLGFAIISMTCLVNALLMQLEVPVRYIAQVAASGVTIAMGIFVAALLVMPGASSSPIARLRRALDGLAIGIFLLFTFWMLVIAPRGHIDSLAFWISILTCSVLSIAIVSALRSGPAWRAPWSCAAGVCCAVIGINGLAFHLGADEFVGWPSAFALVIAAGGALVWHGVRRMSEAEEPPPADPAATFAMYPVLAAPAATAIAVALHRVISGGEFDRPSVLLGVVGIVLLAARESLGALDVARYARRVEQQEAQFRSLVAGSTDVIVVLDDELVVRWQSPAAARQFGLSDQDVVGRHFPSMIHPADAVLLSERLADVRAGLVGGAGEHPALVEARLRDGFGQWRETESSISDQRDVAEISGIVVHVRDIGERKEMERTMHRLAYADPLTGLANRRQALQSVVALRATAPAGGALLLVELDGFAALNDVRGYDVGDAVLVEVARRLRAGVAESDVPARLSGDEFAVVTDASPVAAYALATRLVTMLADPITLPGTTIRLTASVGVAEIAGATSADDVVRRADLALHRAKQLGRSRVEWYDEKIEKALMRRMTVEQELPGALERGEFDLIYQPILDLVARRPHGVEALLRWRHPRLGTLLPGEIIPVAEELGLMTRIGEWVLHESGRQLSGWLREGRNLSMAVNVSPRQLRGDLPGAVADALAASGVPAERMVIELAEGGLADDSGPAEQRLGELRSLGVRTALDEFGTGAESLTYLRRLPVDMVKVGRSFFADIVERPGQTVPIIDVMVGLGRRLGIDVVAQGLEAPAHLELVRGAGCRLGQGHLFSHPQPAERIEAYLDGFPAR